MKAKFARFFTLLLVLQLIGVLGPMQQVAFCRTQAATVPDPDLDPIRASIRTLEAKDADPTLPRDTRDLNRQFLNERRNQLLALLSVRLENLRKYQESIRSSITVEMNQTIDAKVQALVNEIASVKAADGSSTLGASPVTPPSGPVASPETAAAAGPAAGPPAPEVVEARPTRSLSQTTADKPEPVLPTTEATSPSVSIADGADLQDCSTYDPIHPKQFSMFASYACVLSQNLKGRADHELNLLDDLLKITLLIIAKKDRPAFLVEAEEARTDKQVGAGPSTSGTTSLVVKGSAPTVLGLAVENGALTQTINGTTFTFRGNPYGIVQALANKGFIQSYDEAQNAPITRFLKNTSFHLSFDTSRTPVETGAPNVFTADKQQLSEFGVRYEFYNKRDPRNAAYKAAWDKFVDSKKLNVQAMTRELTERGPDPPHALRLKDPALRSWFEASKQALQGAQIVQIEGIVRQRLQVIPINSLSSATVDSLNRFRAAFEDYIKGRNDILAQIAKGGIVSFEYTNKREVNAPNLSNFTFIAEKGLGGRFDGTFNGSLTIFDKIPAGTTGRVRDFNFSGQGDLGLGDVRGIGNLVLSFSGKYQRLMEDAMTPDGMAVMNTKGDLVYGQAKLTIPIKGLGVKMPISVTLSNRTELIKEKEVRGNIGFTFDLDTIFAKFKP